MFLLVLMVGQALAFSVTQHKPSDEIVVKQGGRFTLMCTVDGWYEWCTFKRGERACEYEWKRSAWNVTELNCEQFSGRAHFQGEYNQYQCGITILDARPEDSGEWNCDLEEYNRGGQRGAGAKALQTFSVRVEVPTTTTTSTTTTTESTTTTTTTTTATSSELPPSSSSSTEEYVYEETDMDKERKEDMEDYQEADSDVAARNEDTVEDQEVKEESMLPVGLAIFFILVIISAAAFGLHYKRKLPPSFYSVFTRKWKPVLPHEEFPVTEEEEERHPSIIKNGAKPVDLNVSELGPMGDSANINPDLTTVSFIHDEKVEDLKKDLAEDITDAHKDVKDTEEEEKKDEEKEEQEKKEAEREEGPSETTPLNEPETK